MSSPGDLLDTGIEPAFLISPALQVDSLPLVPPGKSHKETQPDTIHVDRGTLHHLCEITLLNNRNKMR